jgi:hypothetical protein
MNDRAVRHAKHLGPFRCTSELQAALSHPKMGTSSFYRRLVAERTRLMEVPQDNS